MTKTIGFVFIDGFADWEFGLLSASAVEWFGARAVALSPGGRAVRSIAGFTLQPERDIAPEENVDLDAVAAIGSDVWASEASPDPGPLLAAVHGRGGVIGGICGATLALARAGLLKDVAHTSNGREWITGNVPDYPGYGHHLDTPRAVVDGRIVTAPGSAPASFAVGFLKALFPDHSAQIDRMEAIFSREHETGEAY